MGTNIELSKQLSPVLQQTDGGGDNEIDLMNDFDEQNQFDLRSS